MELNTLATNQLVIEGEAVEIETLRFTPAGIPLLRFTLRHLSEQIEAGTKRKVGCDVHVVALGKIATQAQHLTNGTQVKVLGFLNKLSAKSTQLVLHINELEIRK